MVMEYLEGSDLGVVLETEEAIPVEDAVDYVLQACEALAEVHGLGIVHRDLKPGNLFLTRGADGLSCVKLIDFGISRMLVRGAVTLEHAANGLELSTSWTALDAPLTAADAVGLTQPETVMGSPRYMAPEQMESAARADSRSDLYGLGAVLYELLTKHAPHEGDTFLDLFAAVSLHPPVPPSTLRDGIPRELDKVILRCLKLDPAARYVDTAQLAAALAPFGPAGSTERAASIARILGASRRRASHTDSSPSSMHDSRVRRRASSSAYAVRRRLVRWGSAIALLALVVLATWGQALYARGETRGEPSPMPVPAVALPMALFVAPAPPPAPPTPVVLEARPVAPPPLVTALVAARTHVAERTLFEDRK
jgi:serine/threonine-protein kinase